MNGRRLVAPFLALAVGASLALGGPVDRVTAATPTLAQLIGQKLVVAMSGTTPSADLLGRIRRGEVGGVILFGSNVTTKTALVSLTKQLHAAAAAGGQPRFLVAVDQEGGSIKRIPWAPPTLSPPQMGALGSTTTARSQGQLTGAALKALGIDVDLAPVADVPASTSSFLYQQGRTWSFSATRTASLSDAFSTGLELGGEIPSMKHFPGLGYATLNTDTHMVSIRVSRTALAPGLLPYRTAIPHGMPLIMLSNATYSAYDPYAAAGWSPAINTTLLRGTLGFRGVTITDSLDGTAASRGYTTAHIAYRAAKAGTDMLLITGSEATSRGVFSSLLSEAQSGAIPLSLLQASYARILALKNR
ncbi:MAG TPA: glycoside hydrolase family 3 N-terminal domain-containing protein [Candidatus Limnocylindrales bacterium]|jgi:beta-N-acetylhexosaminidase